MNLVLLIFCVFAVVVFACIIRYRGVDRIFLPSTFFILFMISDAFIPLLSWILTGKINQPSWMSPLTTNELGLSAAYYFLFMSLFLCILIFLERRFELFRYTKGRIDFKKIGYILSCGCVVFGSLAFLKIFLEVSAAGGLSGWLIAKSLGGNVRVSGDLVANRTILDVLPINSIFYSLSGLGFCLRNNIKPKILFRIVFPLLSLIISITSMLRGSVLFCLMIFVFAEYVRQRYDFEKMSLRSIDKSQISKQAVILVFCVFLTMIVFGNFRDIYRGANNSATPVISSSSSSSSLEFLISGHGFVGLSQVVENFGVNNEYLLGRTYIDMLLLPIPRSIYTTKPVWYGIDDISRDLGWPASTQTAISMPGEAFANFGVAGLGVAVPFALLFALLVRLLSSSIFSQVMLGPLVFFNTPSVTNWMGFTGFMNSILLMLILYLLALIIERFTCASENVFLNVSPNKLHDNFGKL